MTGNQGERRCNLGYAWKSRRKEVQPRICLKIKEKGGATSDMPENQEERRCNLGTKRKR
jgi:hypothetical protein